MRGAFGVDIVELLGVKGKAEGGTDTWAESLGVTESKDAVVVDLRLDESSGVKVTVRFAFSIFPTPGMHRIRTP
jgi:hypothetical protein